MEKFVEQRLKLLKGGKLTAKQRKKLNEITKEFKKRVMGGMMYMPEGGMLIQGGSKARVAKIIQDAKRAYSYARGNGLENVAGKRHRRAGEISKDVSKLVQNAKKSIKKGVKKGVRKGVKTARKEVGLGLESDVMKMINKIKGEAKKEVKKGVKKVAGKKKRQPSEYNKFMKKCMKGKKMTMKEASALWRRMKK